MEQPVHIASRIPHVLDIIDRRNDTVAQLCQSLSWAVQYIASHSSPVLEADDDQLHEAIELLTSLGHDPGAPQDGSSAQS